MRFEEFECELIDTNLEELGVKHKCEPAKVCINLDTVTSFREAFSNEELGVKTAVHLIDGESWLLNIPYEDFKNKIAI